MTHLRRALATGLIAATFGATFAATGLASAFVAWQVTGISSDDVLMVRAFPNATSRILVGYPEGVVLSMTGTCTEDVRLDDIQGMPASAQRQLVRTKWCEVWLDPYGTGEFRNGWVFGRYIRPA
jgi:hypothetical protein